MVVRAAALSAFLMVIGAAQAQNLAAPSDSYICNHGDQAASATKQACARLLQSDDQAAPAPPVGGPSASPPSSPAPTAPTAPAAKVTPAAPPPPTDVGEAPDNGSAASTSAPADDEDSTHVSINGGWLSGLGAAAVVALIAACLVGLALYFLPTIIALARQKRNALPIFVLNAFLGWSFIGWVAALVWALAAEPVRPA